MDPITISKSVCFITLLIEDICVRRHFNKRTEHRLVGVTFQKCQLVSEGCVQLLLLTCLLFLSLQKKKKTSAFNQHLSETRSQRAEVDNRF